MWLKVISSKTLPADHYAVFKSLTSSSKVDRDSLYKELGISKNNPKKDRSRVCSPLEFREEVRKKGLVNRNTENYGIPQGSPISAMLSNIYMLDFDSVMSDHVKKIDGSYYRYCDDMIILTHPENRDSVIEFAISEIAKMHLSINQDKTEIANFVISAGKQKSDKLLQYLGFTYDGERILLRSGALARYSAKMKAGIKLAKLTRDKHNAVREKNGLPEKKLYRRKIYEQYSHLGKQNFLTYGYRSAKKMDSPNIKKQLKPLWDRLIKEIEK
jgi:hypothetical protein